MFGCTFCRTVITECREIYDLILIDCHPSGSIFTKTSLQNSDHVLIPVVPQAYALRGIGLMMEFIKATRIQHSSPVPHILFNYTKRNETSTIEKQIRGSFQDNCMENTLKKFTAFSEPMAGEGFVWYSKKPYSALAYFNLRSVARKFIERIEER